MILINVVALHLIQGLKGSAPEAHKSNTELVAVYIIRIDVTIALAGQMAVHTGQQLMSLTDIILMPGDIMKDVYALHVILLAGKPVLIITHIAHTKKLLSRHPVGVPDGTAKRGMQHVVHQNKEYDHQNNG